MKLISKTERKAKNRAAMAAIFLFLAAQTFAQKAAGKEPLFKIENAPPPEKASWQAQLAFPDRQGEVDDSLALNSLYAFDFFSGQGEFYVQVGKAVASFGLFINQERVDTSALKSGASYKIDISKIARDGKNILQAASVQTKKSGAGDDGKIKIFVPYPVLKSGTVEASGIDKDAFALISEIIQSDIERGFPCAQLAVAKGGQLVYKNSWGCLNSYDADGVPIPQEQRKKVTDDTLFDMASCTKALVTNCALEYLVSNKQLALDTKIADVLGDEFYKKTINIKYKNGSGASLSQIKKWKAALTIRDVACHSAGFPAGPAYYNINFNSQTQAREKENQKPKNKLYAGCGADETTRAKTYEAVCKTPLMYQPGTRVM